MRRYPRTLTVALMLAGAVFGAEHRGVVKSSGLPIPGAVITASQGARKLVTSTDDVGAYVFLDLAEGAWIVEVEAFGFEKATRTLAASAGSQITWDLTLGASGAPQVAAKAEAPRAAEKPAPAQSGPVRAAAPGPQGRPQNGTFQRLGVNQTVENETLSALAAQTGPDLQSAELNQNANESFLVNGSLSRGLQMPRQEGEMGGPGMGFPGGPMMGGQQGPNAPGFDGSQPQIAGPGAGGPGAGGPGMGGPGGGFGGGGRGMGGPGGGFGGPRGGPGDRRAGGPQRPGWQGRDGTMAFGNRRGGGRDAFRGNAFFSVRNAALDARPYSLTGQTVDKASYAQTRFGFSGGGPLQIPKLFKSAKTSFFFNYTGARSRNPSNFVSTLPSPLERAGDFSQSIARGPVVIYDPLTQLPFPGNLIPETRINTAAKGLLQFIPQPNQPGQVQNYQFVTSNAQNSDNLGTRVFHSLTQKDRIGGSFNFQRRNSTSPQLYQFLDTGSGRGISTDISWTHTLRTGLIGNVRYSFSRNRSTTLPFFAYGPNVASQLGITGTSADPANYGPPNMSFTNFGGLTDGSSALNRSQSSGVNGGLTWVRGKHTLMTGASYQRNQLNNHTDQNGRGTFTFTGLSTSAFDAAGQPLNGTGFDFADFLLGLPQSSSIRFGSSDTYFRGSIYSVFAQDDWRLRSNLTVNVGLRYEYPTPLRELYSRMTNLDVAPGFTAVAPVTAGQSGPYTGAFPNALINPDRNNFAPRFGLAWKPFPKRQVVVRAGYGVYFNASVYNQAAALLAQQPPFANAATFNSSLDNILTLQNGFTGSATQQITNTYAVDRFYQIGYAQTWSASIQTELPHSLVTELGYLGTKGTRLDTQRAPNAAPPGSPLTAEQRRQIGDAVGFTFDSSDGNSIYHAAQARLSRRFRRGLSLNALYTFSKSIDNVASIGGTGSGVVAQNYLDLRAERGLSSFDRRHTFSLSYVVSSPGSGTSNRFAAKGWTGHLIRNWSLSGGINVQSGAPFTATVLGNRSDSSGAGVVGSSRAEATGLPVDLAGAFFNPAAFTLPPSGSYGNAGRNTITGPTSVVANMSLARSFPLGESRRNMEFRADSTNTLNALNVSRIGATVNASNYGLPLATGAMRTMTASLRFRF